MSFDRVTDAPVSVPFHPSAGHRRGPKVISGAVAHCTVEVFTEADRPDLALVAQQVQGESYVDAGYIYPSGITGDGRLHESLDHTRGPQVTYFLASTAPSDPAASAAAAARLVHVTDDSGLDGLPAFAHSRRVLDPWVEKLLRDAIRSRGPAAVYEVAALSRSVSANALLSFEVVRAMYQWSVLTTRRPPIWFATLAPDALESFIRNFGPRVVRRAGGLLEVDKGDPRTSPTLRLTPILVDLDGVLEALLETAKCEPDSDRQAVYLRSLMFVARGLPPDLVSDTVRQTVGSVARAAC